RPFDRDLAAEGALAVFGPVSEPLLLALTRLDPAARITASPVGRCRSGRTGRFRKPENPFWVPGARVPPSHPSFAPPLPPAAAARLVNARGRPAGVRDCSARRGDRAAEGARLESVCSPKACRGFESRLLRQFLPFLRFGADRRPVVRKARLDGASVVAERLELRGDGSPARNGLPSLPSGPPLVDWHGPQRPTFEESTHARSFAPTPAWHP